MLGYEN